MSSNNKEFEVYGGEVLIKFVDSNHSYWIKELDHETGTFGKAKRSRGVTTNLGIIDKPALKFWAVGLCIKHLQSVIDGDRTIDHHDLEEAKGKHKEMLKGATTLGSRIHEWCEAHIKGEKPEMPRDENVLVGVTAFLEWVEKEDWHFVASEVVVYSRKHGYCGQMDWIAYRGKKWWELYAGDFKTSTGLYSNVMIQTAPYVRGIEEMGLEHTLQHQGLVEAQRILLKAKKQKKTLSFVGRYAVRLEKRTPEEFAKDMEEKGKVDTEYLPFEFAYLDYEEDDLEKDWQAYLCTKPLYEWNNEASGSWGKPGRMDKYLNRTME